MISTLALKKSDYESEVGSFMGWGRGVNGGDPAWSDSTVIKLQMDVASGLRRFYWCGHPWSFLKQMVSVELAEGATTVELPECYAGLDGGVEISVLDSSENWIIKLMLSSVNRVQTMEGQADTTGPPVVIAQRPVRGIGGGKMQRNEFYVYPEADQAYTLKFDAFYTPDYLLDVNMPYAVGGVEHHETILESCLAVAEARRDDMLGVHAAELAKLMQKSIDMDQRKQPIRLGYNRDRSDGPDISRWNGHGWGDAGGGVSVDGISYS